MKQEPYAMVLCDYRALPSAVQLTPTLLMSDIIKSALVVVGQVQNTVSAVNMPHVIPSYPLFTGDGLVNNSSKVLRFVFIFFFLLLSISHIYHKDTRRPPRTSAIHPTPIATSFPRRLTGSRPQAEVRYFLRS